MWEVTSMKAEKWFTALWATLLAFLLSFGSISCLVTAFRFTSVSLGAIGLWCGLAAAVSALAVTEKKTWMLPPVIGLAVLWFWRTGALSRSLETLLCFISRFYDGAYKWGTLRWSEEILVESDMQLILTLMALVIAFLVSWTLCRRKLGIEAMLGVIPPFASCLVVTDTVPSIWCLTLFLVGMALFLLTHTVRRQSERRANRLTAALLIPVTLILSLLFYATPPAEYTGQLRADEMTDFFIRLYDEISLELGIGTNLGGNGFGIAPNTISLSTVGPRARLQLVVMDATASFTGNVYLRNKAYDTYTGTSWTASDTVWGLDGLTDWYGHDEPIKPHSIRIETRRVRPNIFLPYYCVDSDMYKYMSQGQVPNSNEKTDYSLGLLLPPEFGENWWQDLHFQNPGYLGGYIPEGHDEPENDLDQGSRGIVYPSPVVLPQYTDLPEASKNGALELLEAHVNQEYTQFVTIAAGTKLHSNQMWMQSYARTQRELAVAIANYVRGSASYDLRTPRMPGEENDFALWFLEDSDTGYCVHFATATAVLLRAAGINARYVEGYTFYAQEGEEVTVREEKAHAWVEYYQTGIGWVVLEATPASQEEPETTTPETTVPETTVPETTVPETTEPPETTVPPETTRPGVTAPSQGTQPTTPGQQEPQRGLTWLWNLLKVILTALAVLGAVAGQRLLRLRLRQNRFRKGDSKAQALARWREIERLSRMTKTEPAEELLRLARKAKFSQHDMLPEELFELDEAIGALQDRLKKDTFPKRFWYCIVRAAY